MMTVVFKCSKCGLTKSRSIEKELRNNHINCPQCGNLVTVYYVNQEQKFDLKDLAKILEKIAISLSAIESKLDRIISNEQPTSLYPVNKNVPENQSHSQSADEPQQQHTAKSSESGLYEEIVDFFAQKNITIQPSNSLQEIEDILEPIATFIGNRYNLTKKFYERLKSNLSNGDEFIINLKNDSQQEVSAICQLGNDLYKVAFLEEYYYKKAPHFTLRAKPSQNPKAINFLTGQWLEIFIKKQMINSLHKIYPNAKYAFLTNGKVTLPNGDISELDIIFKTEKDLFWFEAKTKDYQRHIDKYRGMASLLNLDRDHVYLILADATESSAKNLSSLYNITVTTVDQFSQIFEDYLRGNSSS